MHTLLWLLVAYLVDFSAQLPPALVPPSWAILAFFYIHFQLPLLPLTLGGAVSSTLGRLVLALGARQLGRRFISQQKQENLDHLGVWLNKRPAWQIAGALFLFAIGPIPSNQVFIAAGLTRTRLTSVAVGFLLGRAVSYTFLAEATKKAVSQIQAIFAQYFHSWSALIGIAVTIAVIYALLRINWIKLLHIPVEIPAAETPSESQKRGTE